VLHGFLPPTPHPLAMVGHKRSPPTQPPTWVEGQSSKYPHPIPKEKNLQDELSLPILLIDCVVVDVAKNLDRVMVDVAKPIGIYSTTHHRLW
jgi:hypothetical protein